MTEKELKKLSRKQLLELLLEQTLKVDRLEKQVQAMQKKLDDRRILESEAGNIAEAALKINHVFEAVQAAADQYLANVKRIGNETN